MKYYDLKVLQKLEETSGGGRGFLTEQEGPGRARAQSEEGAVQSG